MLQRIAQLTLDFTTPNPREPKVLPHGNVALCPRCHY